jgi:hypothetical protein
MTNAKRIRLHTTFESKTDRSDCLQDERWSDSAFEKDFQTMTVQPAEECRSVLQFLMFPIF